MEARNSNIDEMYERYYAERQASMVYPTEFVVRTFLAKYPQLNFTKLSRGAKVLDIAFGDGRNTGFLCDCGFDVSGIEIAQGIVDQTKARLDRLGHISDLRVGRNSSIPFDDEEFDCILACHCCYYCDDGQTLSDNLKEYSRVLRPGAYLVASVANSASYIFNGATQLNDGSRVIAGDPYGNRNGYRLFPFASTEAIQDYFSNYFQDFSFGTADNNYYGVNERLFWVVCRKLWK